MITTDLNRAEFDGNGSSKSFVFASGGTNIPIRDESHIKVYVGAVLQTITTHYTVSFVGTTATVTFGTAPASGTKNVLFIREVPFTQDTDLVNNSLLEAESLERQLDLVVNQTQQLNERIDKNFRLSDTLPDSDATTTHTTLNLSATSRANKAVKFDASGNIGVSTLDIDSLSTQVTAAEAAATLATTKANLAAGHETAAEALLDSFDDRYLGVKGSDPTVDNDNQTLVDGAIYYSSADDVIKVYDSSLTPKWRQITTTVANQTNIDTLVLGKDGTASTSGTNTNIAQVNTVALNLTNVNNFADLYQISDFDPAPEKDGGGVDALVAGDLAYDTDAKALRVYNGTAWSSGVNTTEGIIVRNEYIANGSTKHFALAHDQGMELVFLNGVKLLSGDGSANNDFFSVSGSSSTTYVGDNNAATHIYFHTAPTNTHVISLVAYGASSNTLAVPPSGGTFTGSVAFNAGLTGTTGTFSGAVTFSGDLKTGNIKAADGTASVTIANSTGVLTVASPVINTGISGTAILDSDTMSGASATKLATSESIKAYVDTADALKAPIANPTFTGSFTSPGIDDNADAIAMTITNAELIGVGTTTPNAKAILDLTSTTLGFLPPRMTTTQRNAISSVPAGLMIYNTTTERINFHNGSDWLVCHVA